MPPVISGSQAVLFDPVHVNITEGILVGDDEPHHSHKPVFSVILFILAVLGYSAYIRYLIKARQTPEYLAECEGLLQAAKDREAIIQQAIGERDVEIQRANKQEARVNAVRKLRADIIAAPYDAHRWTPKDPDIQNDIQNQRTRRLRMPSEGPKEATINWEDAPEPSRVLTKEQEAEEQARIELERAQRHLRITSQRYDSVLAASRTSRIENKEEPVTPSRIHQKRNSYGQLNCSSPRASRASHYNPKVSPALESRQSSQGSAIESKDVPLSSSQSTIRPSDSLQSTSRRSTIRHSTSQSTIRQFTSPEPFSRQSSQGSAIESKDVLLSSSQSTIRSSDRLQSNSRRPTIRHSTSQSTIRQSTSPDSLSRQSISPEPISRQSSQGPAIESKDVTPSTRFRRDNGNYRLENGGVGHFKTTGYINYDGSNHVWKSKRTGEVTTPSHGTREYGYGSTSFSQAASQLLEESEVEEIGEREEREAVRKDQVLQQRQREYMAQFDGEDRYEPTVMSKHVKKAYEQVPSGPYAAGARPHLYSTTVEAQTVEKGQSAGKGRPVDKQESEAERQFERSPFGAEPLRDTSFADPLSPRTPSSRLSYRHSSRIPVPKQRANRPSPKSGDIPNPITPERTVVVQAVPDDTGSPSLNRNKSHRFTKRGRA